jgi:hypothetical protein
MLIAITRFLCGIQDLLDGVYFTTEPSCFVVVVVVFVDDFDIKITTKK